MAEFIASNQLLDSFTGDETVNLNELYLHVVPEVAIALLCNRFGGCAGETNPVVLRQCITRMTTSNGACYVPDTIYAAIYQTLTPLEFIAFETFYRQIAEHNVWRQARLENIRMP